MPLKNSKILVHILLVKLNYSNYLLRQLLAKLLMHITLQRVALQQLYTFWKLAAIGLKEVQARERLPLSLSITKLYGLLFLLQILLYMEASKVENFKVQKRPFVFEMNLEKREGGHIVAIELTNYLRKQDFHLQINQSMMETNESLAKFYETPIQLFKQIKEMFNELNIDSFGVITFEVLIGKTKKRLIKLQTQKKLGQSQNSGKVYQLKEQFKLLKKQLTEQISELKLAQENFKNQLKQLKVIGKLNNLVNQQKRQISAHKQELLGVKNALSKKLLENGQLSEAVSVLSFEVKQLSSANQAVQRQLKFMRQRFSLLQNQLPPKKQKPDPQVKNTQKKQQKVLMNEVAAKKQLNSPFIISKINHNRYRLSRNSPSKEYIGFITEFRILPNTISCMRFSTVKSQTSRIFIGFCTKELIGCPNVWQYKQAAAAIDLQNGSIWYGGSMLYEGKSKIVAKRIVEMEMDMVARKVYWKYIDGPEQVLINSLVDLPAELCSKELFFHVSICKNQDLIDLITG